MIDEDSGCDWSGGLKEKRKTETEDHLKRDLVGVGGEWGIRARDRGEWRPKYLY